MNSLENEHILYSKFTKLYEVVFKPFFLPAIKKAMKTIEEEQPESILELGVGTGYSLKHYPSGSRVTGIDISKQMVEQSRRRAQNIVDKDFSIIQTDGESLPFPKDSFDLAVSFSVITVVGSPQDFLNQIKKVLKPGKKVIIIMHSRGSGFSGLIDKIFEIPCKWLFGFTILRHINDLDLSGWKVESNEVASSFLGYPYNHKIVLTKEF